MNKKDGVSTHDMHCTAFRDGFFSAERKEDGQAWNSWGGWQCYTASESRRPVGRRIQRLRLPLHKAGIRVSLYPISKAVGCRDPWH